MESKDSKHQLLLTSKRRDEILKEIYRYYDHKKELEIDEAIRSNTIRFDAVKAINDILNRYEEIKNEWERTFYNGKTVEEERREKAKEAEKMIQDIFGKSSPFDPFDDIWKSTSEAANKQKKAEEEARNKTKIRDRARWIRTKKETGR